MCPFCQSRVNGQHGKACKEMRLIWRIDRMVDEAQHFHHTKTLLRVIFHKRSQKR